jgi:hypothetical protein
MAMCFCQLQPATHAFQLLIQMAVRLVAIVDPWLYNCSARKIETAVIVCPICWE